MMKYLNIPANVWMMQTTSIMVVYCHFQYMDNKRVHNYKSDKCGYVHKLNFPKDNTYFEQYISQINTV